MQPGCQALASPRFAQDESIRQLLRSVIGPVQFDHWFRDKTLLVIDDDVLVVQAPSPFMMQWLQKQFRPALVHCAQAQIGSAARVRFEVAAEPVAAAKRGHVRIDEPGSRPARHVSETARPAPASPTPAATTTSRTEVTRRPGRRFSELGDLVPGPCNELALTAVRHVCERPFETGGPLYVYGAVGTGKTHLLEGMYRQLRRSHSQLNTLYLSSEQFTNYFTQAYREHTLPAFRQRFRTVDVLLVDDVDFLDAKRVVQEEFLHTFRQLEGQGRLVVACGDRHPRLLTKISDELRTRLLSGMLCRLETPGLETREKIVARRAGRLDAEFSPEALRYVAERFSGSVRELEGALNSLQVYFRLSGKRVGITAARQVLADLERDCLRIVRLTDVERTVCELFGVAAEELRSARRTRTISEPRMVAMFLARRHTRAAYSEIGQHFGGRNHATVISAEKKVVAWLAADASVRVAARDWRVTDVVELLEQQLLAG